MWWIGSKVKAIQTIYTSDLVKEADCDVKNYRYWKQNS